MIDIFKTNDTANIARCAKSIKHNNNIVWFSDKSSTDDGFR